MLKRALIFFGWGIIIVTSVYEFRQILGVFQALTVVETGVSNSVDNQIKDSILWILTGIFQGVGIGLLCLFAATKIKTNRDLND